MGRLMSNARRWFSLPLVILCGLLLGQQSAAQAETIRGTVRSLTTAPKGETDGAVLDNGTVLHWPPHLEDRFESVAVVGDRVEAVGQVETAPRGETHFEVRQLKNLRTDATAANDDQGPGGKLKPPRERRRSMRQSDEAAATTARGTVRELTTAPRGEIDGAILKDGTTLHWPPHLENKFKNVAVVGDRVEAIGRTETAPRGESHFEVQQLTNRDTGATAENDDQPPAPGRQPSANSRHERIRQLQEQLNQLQRQLEELRHDG